MLSFRLILNFDRWIDSSMPRRRHLLLARKVFATTASVHTLQECVSLLCIYEGSGTFTEFRQALSGL